MGPAELALFCLLPLMAVLAALLLALMFEANRPGPRR